MSLIAKSFVFSLAVLVAPLVAVGKQLPEPARKTSISKLLTFPEIQKELELSSKQIDGIRDLNREMMNSLQELQTSQSGLSGDKAMNMEEYGSLTKSILSENEEQIMTEILSEPQVKRLKQVTWRLEIQRTGLNRFLTNKEVTNYLGMSEEDRKEFFKKIGAARVQLMKDVQKLQMEMERKLISSLPDECLENIENLIGDDFQMDRAAWSQRQMKQSQ